MKRYKLLLIILLIVGCDYAPTDHTHEHEHDTTHEHEPEDCAGGDAVEDCAGVCGGVAICGCTISTASNFNPNATVSDDSCEYGEFQEVEWIYYGNDNQPLTGCYWTGITFPNQTIGSEEMGMFVFKDSNNNIHNIICESGGYGQTDYIRYFADEDYFSILSINPIYPHNYDILMYEYKSN